MGPRGPVLGVVMSEHSPGPGWVDFGPVVQQSAKALAEYGPAVPLTVRPSTPRVRSLTEQADALVASEGLTYAAALREASRRDPDAHARWRAQIRPGVR
jgi:phytoene dehydrogenase-like protein